MVDEQFPLQMKTLKGQLGVRNKSKNNNIEYIHYYLCLLWDSISVTRSNTAGQILKLKDQILNVKLLHK